MPRTHVSRRTVLAGALASLMVAGALPASAVNIPEGGAVTPDSVFLFHLRVIEGCEGLPMTELEVTIPESVRNPTPEAMAGWDTRLEIPSEMDDETEAATDDEAEAAATEEEAAATEEEAATEDEAAAAEAEPELTVIRWENGMLEDGLLLDFGIRARFPDEQDAVIEFPVVQRCGAVEQEFTPTIKLTTRYGQGEILRMDEDISALRADVDQLRSDVEKIQRQIGEVNVTGLRDRVVVLEDDVVELDERVTAIEEQPVPAPLPEE